MDIEAQKRQAAALAVEWVRPGMRLGLGTGSTAKYFVELLAERVRGGLNVIGVPTSETTRADAQRLGVPLTTLDETPELDMTVDGADEVGPDLTLIKGGGGALLREKIVAAASRRMLVVVDQGKLVDRLGGRTPLPVEIAAFGWQSTLDRLAGAGAEPVLRLTPDGEPFRTDGGNHIADCRFAGGLDDAPGLESRLAGIVGVVEVGLFVGLAARALVGTPGGVRVLSPGGATAPPGSAPARPG
jgi:ribose 5-phosphate isomerase A